MSRKLLCLVLIILGSLQACASPTADDAKHPNIVWIVSEDNSMHYLQSFFEGGANTPNIEKLADEGLIYTHAFSNGAVCSVARTTLATGSHAPRIGTQFHRKYEKAALPEDVRLFHSYLKDAGYYVSNVKKTDYNVDVSRTWDDTSGAASWRNRPDPEQPFFHFETLPESHEGQLHFDRKYYESKPTNHDPGDVTVADYLPDTELSRYTHAFYLDKMQQVDGLVGKIVADLEADGVLEDTFIFYFGDHGGVLPRGKGYAYDSGLHVPLVIRIPEKFRDRVDVSRGNSVSGFVEFTDFGPTVLALAGVDVPGGIDGKPFLGADVDMDEVNTRDESLGYADRFDEKYDFVRTLRKGQFRYSRNYQSYFPDGLMNNYRYRMLAYQEWRELYDAGELNEIQRQFFESKPVEALYDAEADPHNVHNLADDPAYAEVLAEMRQRLQQRLQDLPDLGFYPESYLAEQRAFTNPVAFGQAHKNEIVELMATADLALLPYKEARSQIVEALKSDNAMVRMWAVTAAASFGEAARDLEADIAALASDVSEQVRIRVADYLGVTGLANPQSLLASVANETRNPIVAIEALNSVVFFSDFSDGKYPVEIANLSPIDDLDVSRRIEYLQKR